MKNGFYFGFMGYLIHKTKELVPPTEKDGVISYPIVKGQYSEVIRGFYYEDGQWYKPYWCAVRDRWSNTRILNKRRGRYAKHSDPVRVSDDTQFWIVDSPDHIVHTFKLKGYSVRVLSNGKVQFSKK